MKKFFILVCIFLLAQRAYADSLCKIKYNNLTYNAKITYSDNLWSTKNIRNDRLNYKKIKNKTNFKTELISNQNNIHYILDSDYEFIIKGRLIGYSNDALKFYEYKIVDNKLYKRELSEYEVHELFPEYKIIKISDFSDTTNSLKINKTRKDLKLILLNDTEMGFNNYWFTTNNAKFKPYNLKGFIDITKKGMIQFATSNKNIDNTAWFILLVR